MSLSNEKINFNSETLTKSPLGFEMYRLTVKFADFAQSKGLDIKAFNPKNAFDRFLNRPETEQREIIDNFSFYFQALLSLTSKGIPLRDEQQITWHFVKLMGLRPTADLFSRIGKKTIVEIYTATGVQTYRSWAFYSLCSYSVDEINSYPWWELYDRDQKVTDQIVAEVGRVLSGNVKESMPLTVPMHDVREIFGPNRCVTAIDQKFFSPLFDKDGNTKAFVHLFEALKCVKSQPPFQTEPLQAESDSLVLI